MYLALLFSNLIASNADSLFVRGNYYFDNENDLIIKYLEKVYLESKNLWSNGTIAVKIIDEKVLQNNLYFI